MFNTDLEIWEAVKKLEGETLRTIVEHEENKILKVEDTGSANDCVIIENRETKPLREDIIAAYNLFKAQKSLQRIPDLEWLAKPEKKTSSIVFTIIYEISKDEVERKGTREVKLVLK